jgi:hypothetical protein
MFAHFYAQSSATGFRAVGLYEPIRLLFATQAEMGKRVGALCSQHATPKQREKNAS